MIFSPNYANLPLGCFDIKLHNFCKCEHGELIAEHI